MSSYDQGYTCIECGHKYNDEDGDTDERMCNECINKLSHEELVERLEKAESIESAIETLTGNYPEKVEENCDSTWFKADGKWYFIMIEKCAENAMEGKEK